MLTVVVPVPIPAIMFGIIVAVVITLVIAAFSVMTIYFAVWFFDMAWEAGRDCWFFNGD